MNPKFFYYNKWHSIRTLLTWLFTSAAHAFVPFKYPGWACCLWPLWSKSNKVQPIIHDVLTLVLAASNTWIGCEIFAAHISSCLCLVRIPVCYRWILLMIIAELFNLVSWIYDQHLSSLWKFSFYSTITEWTKVVSLEEGKMLRNINF